MAKRQPSSSDLLRGTLHTLILKTLTWGPRHGYGIARYLEDISDDALRIEEGSLYPALYRLEKHGHVESEWGVSELGRRAKHYRLTPEGRELLARETADWTHFARVVSRVLTAEPAS